MPSDGVCIAATRIHHGTCSIPGIGIPLHYTLSEDGTVRYGIFHRAAMSYAHDSLLAQIFGRDDRD